MPWADLAVVVQLTAGCAVAALVAGWLLLRLLRGRSVLAHLLVTSCAALATVAGAVLLTTRAMFLSDHDSHVVLVVSGLAVVSAAGVSLVLARSLRGAGRSLAASAVLVGDPAYGGAPAMPTGELGTRGPGARRRAPAAGASPGGRPGHRAQPPAARRRDEPRPAHPPHRDAGHGRVAGGRRRHRPRHRAEVPPAARRRGRRASPRWCPTCSSCPASRGRCGCTSNGWRRATCSPRRSPAPTRWPGSRVSGWWARRGPTSPCGWTRTSSAGSCATCCSTRSGTPPATGRSR